MEEKKPIIRNYTNKDIDVLWQPAKCIHSGNCVRALPQVFKPKERPWVQMENGTTQQIEAAVDTCPTAALSYTLLNDSQKTNEMKNQDNNSNTSIEIAKGGPLIVRGEFTIQNEDGTESKVEKPTAFCRCGASKKEPYCDGTHKKVGFEG